jgi:hypothetical protein
LAGKQYGIEAAEPKQDDANAPLPGEQPAGAIANLPRAPNADTAVVWKLHPDNSIEPVKVSLGIADHAFTGAKALLKGELKEGEPVIILITFV